MQNLVCRHISSTLVNSPSLQFLSYLLVSSSKHAIFTLAVETADEDSLCLLASQPTTATFDGGLPWDLATYHFIKTRIVEWTSTTRISGFLYLEESDAVIVSLSTGEIFQIPCIFNYLSKNNQRNSKLEDFGRVETVGIFPQGIHCMQSSPDGEVLCLLTGKSQVQIVFMATEEWEILTQQDLYSFEDSNDNDDMSSAWNITWRSDGAFVSITYPLKASNKIQMVVFRRERFTLESTCEEVWESSCCYVDWQPRMGGAIAASLSNETNIRFYETNGLALRRLFLDAEIHCKQLEWTEQYPILVCGDETKIRIFYHSNYHWYLKQEWIFSEFGEIAAFRVVQDKVATDTSILYVLTSNGNIFCYVFQWQFDICKLENDECYLAAIDASEIAITMLSQQVIPPPLCSLVLVCSCPVQRVEMDSQGGCLALLSNGTMEYFCYDLMKKADWKRVTCTKGKQLENNLDKIYKESKANFFQSSFHLPCRVDKKQGLVWKVLLLSPVEPSKGKNEVSLGSFIRIIIIIIGEQTQLHVYEQHREDNRWEFCYIKEMKDVCLDMQPIEGHFSSETNCRVVWLSEDTIALRNIMKEDQGDDQNVSLQMLGLKGHQIVRLKSVNTTRHDGRFDKEEPSIAIFFLDNRGRLWMVHVLHHSSPVLLISEDCVSFEVVPEFLFFTSRFHKLYTCPMDKILNAVEENVSTTENYRKWEWNETVDCRPIDRFSRIVTFISDTTSNRNNCLVLQAPRGNLECVVPRLVIRKIVEQHIERGAYGEAYRLCRRHRLPMDILVEKNPERFKACLLDFIRQFKDIEHLNTFVSALGSEKEDTVRNEWCDMLIEAFRQLQNEPKYRYPLICAFLQKKPADVSGALEVLQLQEHEVSDTSTVSKDITLKEDLMDFLLLLTKDSVLVFRKALGLYDLSLAALVVERASDLDPAYYGNLLRRLSDPCPEKQKYLIDLELGNMESALRHLFAFSTFPENSDTVVEFAIEHQLFSVFCSLFADYPDLLKRVRQAYAEDLSRKGQHLDAACLYALIEQDESARKEYERACIWQLVVYFSHKLLWKRCSGQLEKCSMDNKANNAVQYDNQLISEMDSLIEHLKLNGKGKEAAYIYVDYLNDPQSALEQLIQIEEWLDAMGMLGRMPLQHFCTAVETTWQPALIHAVQEHIEEWKEVTNKMVYYGERLQQVRYNKKNINTVANEAVNTVPVQIEDEMLSESDASSYSISSWGEWTMSSETSKASLYSLLSKKGQKRKTKKKSKHIKPGDPREEEYLVDCLSKMIPSFAQWDSLNQLLHCLVGMSMEKEARKLYGAMKNFASCVQGLPEDIVGRNNFIQVCFQKWKCLEQLPDAF